MKKQTILAGLIIIVLAIVAGIKLSGTKASKEASTEETTAMPMNAQTAPAETNPQTQLDAGVILHVSKAVTFDVNGGNFYLKPNMIKVNKGDTVTINFKNDGGIHDLKIDAFNVSTPVIQAGQAASITFVADKTGTFEYYCSVGSHRAMGMKGTLIVE